MKKKRLEPTMLCVLLCMTVFISGRNVLADSGQAGDIAVLTENDTDVPVYTGIIPPEGLRFELSCGTSEDEYADFYLNGGTEEWDPEEHPLKSWQEAALEKRDELMDLIRNASADHEEADPGVTEQYRLLAVALSSGNRELCSIEEPVYDEGSVPWLLSRAEVIIRDEDGKESAADRLQPGKMKMISLYPGERKTLTVLIRFPENIREKYSNDLERITWSAGSEIYSTDMNADITVMLSKNCRPENGKYFTEGETLIYSLILHNTGRTPVLGWRHCWKKNDVQGGNIGAYNNPVKAGESTGTVCEYEVTKEDIEAERVDFDLEVGITYQNPDHPEESIRHFHIETAVGPGKDSAEVIIVLLSAAGAVSYVLWKGKHRK